MASCRFCGAETDNGDICEKCAENDASGTVAGQLSLFGDDITPEPDADTHADHIADDICNADGNVPSADTHSPTYSINKTDDTEPTKEPDEEELITDIDAPSDAAEPETVSMSPRDPNYDAVICLSGSRPEAPSSIHAAPVRTLRTEHVDAAKREGAGNAESATTSGVDHTADAGEAPSSTDNKKAPDRDDTSSTPTDNNLFDLNTEESSADSTNHKDISGNSKAVNAAEAAEVNSVSPELSALDTDLPTSERTADSADIAAPQPIAFAYKKHRKISTEAPETEAAQILRRSDDTPTDIAYTEQEVTGADPTIGVSGNTDVSTDENPADPGQRKPADLNTDILQLSYISLYDDELDDSEFLYTAPADSPHISHNTVPDNASADSQSARDGKADSGATGIGLTDNSTANAAPGDNTPNDNTIDIGTADVSADMSGTLTDITENTAYASVANTSGTDASDAADTMPTFELSGGFGSGLISSESEISLLLEYSPSENAIEPDIAPRESETSPGAGNEAAESKNGGISGIGSALKSASDKLRSAGMAIGHAAVTAAAWLKHHPLAAARRGLFAVGRGFGRIGKKLLGTPHHELMFNRGDTEAYAPSACVARIPLMFPLPLILHPHSRYARYSSACGAAVTLVSTLAVLADRLLCLLWRTVFTTTVNRGTSFEHVALTSTGIEAIALTDTIFLAIVILFVAYSIFVAALGNRHPLAPRLLYRIATIGERQENGQK